MLNLLKNGRKGCKEHRKAVFVEKTKKLNVKLTKVKLTSLGEKPVTQKKNTTLHTKDDTTPKAITDAEKSMSLDRERGKSIAHILTHDLLVTCQYLKDIYHQRLQNQN